MKKTVFILLAVFALFQITSCSKNNETIKNKLRIEFLDTGKSDCIIIQMDDLNIICDTADKDDYTYIASRLEDLHIQKIDFMILSHFDKDHIGSAGSIVRNFDVETIYVPDYEKSSDEYYDLISATEKKSSQLIVMHEDDEITTENGHIKISVPQSTYYDDENNFSLITSIEYGNVSALLAGDALKERLSEYIDSLTDHHYDIIKIPHHGEYNKSVLSLLSNADAKYCIITSDYEKNTVEKKLIKALETYEVQPLYTADGDIVFESDGKTLSFS